MIRSLEIRVTWTTAVFSEQVNTGGEDTIIFKDSAYFSFTHPRSAQFENAFYNKCCFRINNQPRMLFLVTFILRILLIPIRCGTAYRFTSFSFWLLYCTYFFRSIGSVEVVEEVTYAGHLIQTVDSINTVVHCDETNVVLREYQLHHRVGLQMISPESGLVLNDNCSD